MKKLTLADIGSLQQYLQQRHVRRLAAMEHKKNRRVLLGPNVSLHFEDFITMRHQVQEMMRAEHIDCADAILDELHAYNPLIPDGSNLKCTLMIEFADQTVRREQLCRLVGLEKQVFMQIGDNPPAMPAADEDLERTSSGKTSAVHFLRFEFTPQMITDARNHAAWRIFSTHPAYSYTVDPLAESVSAALLKDFD